MDLKDKVVLITGASAGIGEACARAFARRGSRVILTARNASALERLRSEIEGPSGPGSARSLTADLTRPGEVQDLAARALEIYGRIDVLVNNAGVGLYGSLQQADPHESRRMIELNLFAPLELTRALLPRMRRQGGGTIVNISSIGGKIPLPWLPLYSASKAALNFISDCYRMELSGTGIQVVAVCPGYVRTGFSLHVLGGAMPESVASRNHFTISAEQCAAAVVNGVERGKRTVVVPRSGWLLIGLARVLPWPVHAVLKRMAAPAEGVGS